jgi:hypothetical protein
VINGFEKESLLIFAPTEKLVPRREVGAYASVGFGYVLA